MRATVATRTGERVMVAGSEARVTVLAWREREEGRDEGERAHGHDDRRSLKSVEIFKKINLKIKGGFTLPLFLFIYFFLALFSALLSEKSKM